MCFGIHFGKSERISIDLGFWPFLMHNAVVVESGREGPFHSTNVFMRVIYFCINHFSFYLSPLPFSFSLSFLSPADQRQEEHLQIKVVCWRLPYCSFSASLIHKRGKKLFSEPSNHITGVYALKCARVYSECTWVCLHRNTHTECKGLHESPMTLFSDFRQD